MLKTVVIDDQNLFKEGFRLLLDKMKQHKFRYMDLDIEDLSQKDMVPEVDLIFINLTPGLIEDRKILQRIRRWRKEAKIAILSDISSTKIVRETFQSGIDAYFLKSTTSNELYEGLREVLEGKTYMTAGLRLTPRMGEKADLDIRQNIYNNKFQAKQKLTKREVEVLEHIVQAKSNSEIGDLLFISEQTVGVHKKNIMRKLGVHNTVSLIRFAIDHNLA